MLPGDALPGRPAETRLNHPAPSTRNTAFLEAKGFTVTKKDGLGSAVLREAQENGQVDVYWEYTGTSLITYNKIVDRLSPEDTYKKVKELDAAKGLVWLNPSRANNTYAFAMNQDEAKKLGISTISDLAKAIKGGKTLTFASNSEFYARPDGLRPLEKMSVSSSRRTRSRGWTRVSRIRRSKTVGMTEASLTLLLHPRDALAYLGSCGKPTLISTCRVVKHDPERFKGGWLYTGDLFSVDEAGYFHFHGRADDMIVSGGENIYPHEVEEVLYHCPGIQEAAVIGVPDPKWGQSATAFVARSDVNLTEADIVTFCKASDANNWPQRWRISFFIRASALLRRARRWLSNGAMASRTGDS
jgi:hypothetical protein